MAASFKIDQSWLENIQECVQHNNEEKSAVMERFIRTLENKIYIFMTSISKNVYSDKLDNIVNKYNNIYHREIKMKPVDVKSRDILKTHISSTH